MTVVTLILAGGNSRRMGRDKALLPWLPGGEPEPMLTHLCRVALGGCDRVFVLSPRCDRYRLLLPQTNGSQVCRCLPESRAEADPPPGPLVAFAEGLVKIEAAAPLEAGGFGEADWVLLLACDLPGITAELLREWRSRLEAVPPEAIALLPRSAQGWEPLCGFYRRQRSLEAVRGAVAGGERSFQRWLATEAVAALALESEEPLQNCNSPEDWSKFMAREGS